ncbi:hypothetical protein D9613_007296 [Agrocybe pediades]|uniref:DUF6534 domain-containing protein n=1 Tax=Agrocybe pediades TaxID=84607 RepID=A0A8H4QGR1_9AGAR|nr:hypothetical protein D9613_007296 [Agrocybe pediades]
MTTHFVLHNTFGAAFVGLVVASLLHGVSIVQAWYYFTHQKDPWGLKSIVAAVMFFDTIHEILISHTVYTYVVTDWGNADELDKIVWSLIVSTFSLALSVNLMPFCVFEGRRFNSVPRPKLSDFAGVAIEQRKQAADGNSVYTRPWRAWLCDRIHWNVVRIKILNLQGLVSCLDTIRIHFQTYQQLAKLKYLSILVNALAAAGDVLIAASLCALLHFSRTGFQRSDTMINKLVRTMPSSSTVIAHNHVLGQHWRLDKITVAGNTFLYIAFFFCIGRLYTNSLLATLNARKSIRGAGDAIHTLTTSGGDLSLAQFPKSGCNASRGRPTNISIKIDTTKEFAMDSDQENDRDVEKAESSSSSPRIFDNASKLDMDTDGKHLMKSV